MKRNIKLTIEYDGTDFVGWQKQPNGRTVQDEIETAVKRITQEESSIVGAGRTDSGVHARGQVANFFTSSVLDTNEFNRALNGTLPSDIVIHSVEEVDEKFSARFNAKEREYRYFISKQPTAIDRKYCWRLGYKFEIEKMNRVSSAILGTNDFQSFCKAEFEVDHFLCTVIESHWYEENFRLIYRVRANRFLHGMVRALVGTMVNVGRGHTEEKEFLEILKLKDRSKAGQAAPPQGLFLERVIY